MALVRSHAFCQRTTATHVSNAHQQRTSATHMSNARQHYNQCEPRGRMQGRQRGATGKDTATSFSLSATNVRCSSDQGTLVAAQMLRALSRAPCFASLASRLKVQSDIEGDTRMGMIASSRCGEGELHSAIYQTSGAN